MILDSDVDGFFRKTIVDPSTVDTYGLASAFLTSVRTSTTLQEDQGRPPWESGDDSSGYGMLRFLALRLLGTDEASSDSVWRALTAMPESHPHRRYLEVVIVSWAIAQAGFTTGSTRSAFEHMMMRVNASATSGQRLFFGGGESKEKEEMDPYMLAFFFTKKTYCWHSMIASVVDDEDDDEEDDV